MLQISADTIRHATSAGVISLPDAITLMRSRKPYCNSLSTTTGAPP